MFPLFVISFSFLVRDVFEHVVDQGGEYGGKCETFRRINLGIVNVVQLCNIHPGDHFAGNIFFIDALFPPFFNVDLDFFVDEIERSS